MGLRTRLARLLGWGGKRHELAWKHDSFRQVLNSLRARFYLAQARLPQGEADRKKQIVQEIERIQADAVDWRDTDYAEQLLCFILFGAQLDGELENVLSRAEEQKLARAAARRAEQAVLAASLAAGVEERKQVLLHAILYELQEQRRRASQIRGMRVQAVWFVTMVSMVAMLIVALPFFFYLFHLAYHQNGVSAVSNLVMSFPNFGLFTTVSFGALGALFSRFIILQRSEVGVSLDEAAAYYSWPYILLRVLVGTVGAIIVYYFLGSGLVEGNLVPNIRELTYVPAQLGEARAPIQTFLGTSTGSAMVPSMDMALLIVWAFLAGFSERLVPNLLDETSRRIPTGSSPSGQNGPNGPAPAAPSPAAPAPAGARRRAPAPGRGAPAPDRAAAEPPDAGLPPGGPPE